MGLSVESGAVDYSSAAERDRILDALKSEYPDLRVREYDAIAQDDVEIRGQIEEYVRQWFMRVFYPDYSQATAADLRAPSGDDAGYSYSMAEVSTDAEAEQNFEAFLADNLDLLLEPDVVDMPEEIREAFRARLKASRGDRDGDRQFATGHGRNMSISSGSETYSSGGKSGKNGQVFTSADDIDSVSKYFPSDSTVGQALGWLGDKVLLGRNIQAISAQALDEISQMENEIMARLAGLRESGMKPDDPAYMTEMQELKWEMDSVKSSKEEYMGYIMNAERSMGEITTLISNFIRDMNSNFNQLANNFKVV